ncbi:MAG: S41 family peptidase [Gammaproteobacteria bacterium]|nr:MAG: S41 family peptidase [Gammaproteobacteria bacterium]
MKLIKPILFLLMVSAFPMHSILATAESAPATEQEGLPLEQLRNFSDIFARIKSDYVEPVDDKQLLENAIRGMLSGLDPHSTYLDPNEYKELKIGTSGQFGGLGIQVGMEDGFVKVIAPIDDTPAFKAGIKAGDLIIRLDDKPVKGMSLNDAVNMMRGKPGTSIVLTIVREGEPNPLTFTIERDIINVVSVKSRLLEKNYGYIRISTFQSRTAHHLVEAIDNLRDENKAPLNGLILDLRNNPGGVLNAAADVSDTFLDDGLIVYTKGRIENSYFEFKAKHGDALNGAPMVVLINEGSASASEIVAGALQDHKRAIVMGSKSFGKGSVQTIQELRNGGAVKFTTAHYFTPSGRSIQAEGIAPDIILENLRLTAVETNGVKNIKEADLTGHLENPTQQKPITGDEIMDNGNENISDDIRRKDYQINEALNVLKGLNIMQTKRVSKQGS